MIEAVQILWSPAGANLPALGARALVDVTDGDTPNVRMPIRMLSVDTPEVTARSEARAVEIDQEFGQLAEWIGQQRAPISQPVAEFLLPKLTGGGTRQFQQGKQASAFAKQNIETRLTPPNGTKRNLLIRTADSPFDNNDRLLAYIAPDYSPTERRTLTRQQRATFTSTSSKRVGPTVCDLPIDPWRTGPAAAAGGRQRRSNRFGSTWHLDRRPDANRVRVSGHGEAVSHHRADRWRRELERRRGPCPGLRRSVAMSVSSEADPASASNR
jgi:hypothetical protein